MKRIAMHLAALVALALLVTAPAHALDGDTIDRWIAAMEDFDAWAEEQPADMGHDAPADVDDPADMQAMMAEVERTMAEVARRDDEVNDIARRHGFDGHREWSEVSGRIFSAFYAIEIERALPEMEEEMARGMREMEENPNVPEEQKAAMRDMMQQQLEMMKQAAPDVPEQDRQAVMNRADELRAVFGD